ncbi:MAG: prolipoprotein diacylglyceryl transferase [Chloroflexi bacterium]|nr:prolipoprotein diacylglyceryl transferase [Chloroflexota bacterium]
MIDIGISPVAFLTVRWYGVMIALGVAALVLWMLWRIRRGAAKIPADTVIMAATVGIPSGIVISKLLHVVDNIVAAKLYPELVTAGSVIDYTQEPGLIFNGGGLSAYGAVLGAALGIWVYSRFSRFQFGYFADVAAPGIILAQAIGRVGCTVNGCCYGVPTTLPWGVIYTHPESYAPLWIAVHPTQVYEIFYNLIVFGILVMLRGRLKPDGSVFLVYLSLYALWRVGIDFLREGTPFLFGLHQAQVVSLIILAITLPLLVRTRWVKARPVAQLAEE